MSQNDLNNTDKQELKVVIVGDGAVGKTCLCTVFTTKEFPTSYETTIFDTQSSTINILGKEYNIKIWDTAGQEEYENIRTLSYKNADLFMVLYSVDSRKSLDNIRNKWMTEINDYEPTVPKLLVGTKSDLRTAKGSKDQPSLGEVKKLKKDFKFMGSMECSAMKSVDSVTEVFQEAGKIIINPPRPSGGFCGFPFFK